MKLLDERLTNMLQDPQYKELVDNIDTIIIFENGKFKGNVKVSEIKKKKETLKE